jgi:hypothetical protein
MYAALELAGWTGWALVTKEGRRSAAEESRTLLLGSTTAEVTPVASMASRAALAVLFVCPMVPASRFLDQRLTELTRLATAPCQLSRHLGMVPAHW